MVKVYYRYVRQRVFGVLASSECNVRILCDDTTGTHTTAVVAGVVAGRNELAAVWNSKTFEEAAVLILDEDANKNSSHLAVSVASKLRFTTFVDIHPIDNRIVGVGYSDGTLRLWRMRNDMLDPHKSSGQQTFVNTVPLAAFCGHKNVITSVAFSFDGQYVATGGKDTDIVVWDLLSQKGECRLSGHTQSISSLIFCHASKRDAGTGAGTGRVTVDRRVYYLISGGKDGIIKVWDIKLHFALQTVVDHEGGVNALSLNDAQNLLFTGGASPSLIVYRVLPFGGSHTDMQASSSVLEMYCKVDRRAYFGNIVQLAIATDGATASSSCSRTGTNTAQINTRYGTPAISDTCAVNPDDSLETVALSGGSGTSYVVEDVPYGYVVIANTSKKRMELFLVRHLVASGPTSEWEADGSKPVSQTKKRKKRRKDNGGALATANNSSNSTLPMSEWSNSAAVSSPVQTPDAATTGSAVSIVSWHVLELNDIVQSIDYRSSIQTLILAQRSTGAVAIIRVPFAHIAKVKPQPSVDIKRDLPDEFREINFLPEGHHDESENSLATGDSTVQKKVMHFQGHHSIIRHIAFSHDDLMIATFEENCVKVWNIHSCNCIRAFTDCGKAVTGAFLAGNAHLVVCNAEGSVILYNLNTATASCVVETGAPVTAMCLLLDFTGFYCATSDKRLRRFRFTLSDDGSASPTDAGTPPNSTGTVELDEDHVTEVMDGIGDIKCSIDGKLVCLAYLNNTMQLLHGDTLNVYLTLYGHKLPVTSVAFSTDCTIIASASVDKSIKIWGTDFGNIQKSWIAHNDAVSKIAFATGTHHLVSAGRDGLVKIWDADSKDLVCSFTGHRGAVTALALSLDAHFVVSSGVDRSIRVLMRTEDQFVLEEVREAEAEEQMEKATLASDALNPNSAIVHEEVIVNRTSRDTMTAVRSTELLIETLDNAKQDWDSELIYNRLLAEWQSHQHTTAHPAFGGTPVPASKPPAVPDRKLKTSPHEAVISAVAGISAHAVFEILIALPFAAAEKLLDFIADYLDVLNPSQAVPLASVEASTRVALILVQLHYGVLSVSGSHRKLLLRLQRVLRSSVKGEMDDISFCNHAMGFLRAQSELETSTIS